MKWLFCMMLVLSGLAADEWPSPEGMQVPGWARTQEGGAVSAVAWPLWVLELGDVSAMVDAWAETETSVVFSPDGRYVVVGTCTGRLIYGDIYARQVVWEKQVAEGLVKKVAVSPDGKTIYYGEQSPDGFICALNSVDGKVRWKYRLANDLESSPPPAKDDHYGTYQLPGCYRLKVLDDGDVLALGIHVWGNFNDYTSMNRASRVYRFSPDGELRWAFPEEGSAPMSLVYADADRGGKRVVVLGGVAANGAKTLLVPSGGMAVLDGASGKVVGKHQFMPLTPWFDVVSFWKSVSVGPHGRRASIGMNDGRTFLFDLDTVRPLHAFNFGAPILISGVPVSARSTYTKIAPDGMVYFQTAGSSVPNVDASRQTAQPPGPHPNANTVTVVDGEGKVAWRYRSGDAYQDFWFNQSGRWVLTVTKRDGPDGFPIAGAMLFDTARRGGGTNRLAWVYEVEGGSYFQADMSADGSAAAIVEVPVKPSATSGIRGTYQLHIVR